MFHSLTALFLGLFIYCSSALADAPDNLLQSRQEIMDILHDTSLSAELELDENASFLSVPKKLIDATAGLEVSISRYLKASGTIYRRTSDELGSLSIFEIEPAEEGSWLNQVSTLLDQEGLKFYIRPSVFADNRLGYFHSGERAIYLAAPPFAGALSGTMAHEIIHYLIVQSMYGQAIPHLEQVWLGFPKVDDKEPLNFHFSELSANAAALLDLGTHFNGGELSPYQIQKLSNYGNRLLLYSRAIRVQLLDFLVTEKSKDKNGSLNVLNINPGRAAGVHTENSLGTQLHFDNLNINEPDSILKRSLKLLTPKWTTQTGIHQLDNIQIQSRLRAFHDVVFDLETSLAHYSDMSPAEKMRSAHKPWQWIQDANSKWLERLGYSRSHPFHQHLSERGQLIHCAGGLDPECSAKARCDNLLR